MVEKILRQKLAIYFGILLVYCVAAAVLLVILIINLPDIFLKDIQNVLYSIVTGGLGFSPSLLLVDKIFSLRIEIARLREDSGQRIILTG